MSDIDIDEFKRLLNLIPEAVSWSVKQVHDTLREAVEIVYGTSDTDSLGDKKCG